MIEHAGNWENQRAFASEIRCVSNAIWVQTPAYECPIEPHYLTPFVHWLPIRLRWKLLRHFTLWGLIHRPSGKQIDSMIETIRLLTRKEMQILFPDCTILTERLLGVIPKSYIAIRPRS